MLDGIRPCFDRSNPVPLDPDVLACVLGSLSPEDLDALADDLDFATFTHGMTPRIHDVLARLEAPRRAA